MNTNQCDKLIASERCSKRLPGGWCQWWVLCSLCRVCSARTTRPSRSRSPSVCETNGNKEWFDAVDRCSVWAAQIRARSSTLCILFPCVSATRNTMGTCAKQHTPHESRECRKLLINSSTSHDLGTLFVRDSMLDFSPANAFWTRSGARTFRWSPRPDAPQHWNCTPDSLSQTSGVYSTRAVSVPSLRFGPSYRRGSRAPRCTPSAPPPTCREAARTIVQWTERGARAQWAACVQCSVESNTEQNRAFSLDEFSAMKRVTMVSTNSANEMSATWERTQKNTNAQRTHVSTNRTGISAINSSTQRVPD